MGTGESFDLAWRRSHHGAVYAALTALLDSAQGQPAPGTEGAIARAQSHFRSIGDREAVARLDAIAVLLFQFFQARRARDAAFLDNASARLEGLAREWLLDAPMFPGQPAGYAFAA